MYLTFVAIYRPYAMAYVTTRAMDSGWTFRYYTAILSVLTLYPVARKSTFSEVQVQQGSLQLALFPGSLLKKKKKKKTERREPGNEASLLPPLQKCKS